MDTFGGCLFPWPSFATAFPHTNSPLQQLFAPAGSLRSKTSSDSDLVCDPDAVAMGALKAMPGEPGSPRKRPREKTVNRLTSIYCPECSEEVEPEAPENYHVPGEIPDYRHISDRTALCVVMTSAGYFPASPVEARS